METKENILSGVIEYAEELGITIIDLMEIFEWVQKTFGTRYEEMGHAVVGKLEIFSNLNETILEFVESESLDELLDIDREEYLKANNLHVLTKTNKIIHFSKK